MTRLSETQATILAAAAQRPDGNVLPLPGSLRGGAAGKVVTALLTRGLVRETVADRITRADAAMNTVWRNDDDGRAVLLRIRAAGREAIGVESARDRDRNASGAAATEALGAAAAETPGPADAPHRASGRGGSHARGRDTGREPDELRGRQHARRRRLPADPIRAWRSSVLAGPRVSRYGRRNRSWR
jgi:hypothetical protein